MIMRLIACYTFRGKFHIFGIATYVLQLYFQLSFQKYLQALYKIINIMYVNCTKNYKLMDL